MRHPSDWEAKYDTGMSLRIRYPFQVTLTSPPPFSRSPTRSTWTGTQLPSGVSDWELPEASSTTG